MKMVVVWVVAEVYGATTQKTAIGHNRRRENLKSYSFKLCFPSDLENSRIIYSLIYRVIVGLSIQTSNAVLCVVTPCCKRLLNA
jgi:hypothetical protein